jgi:hypothetical protein
MPAAWLKEGGLFILIFVSKEGCIGEGIKREGAKYRNYSTSNPSSPFPNMLQERGQLQGLKHGFQGQCIACYVPGNVE